MGPWCQSQHARSGLTEAVRGAPAGARSTVRRAGPTIRHREPRRSIVRDAGDMRRAAAPVCRRTDAAQAVPARRQLRPCGSYVHHAPFAAAGEPPALSHRRRELHQGALPVRAGTLAASWSAVTAIARRCCRRSLLPSYAVRPDDRRARTAHASRWYPDVLRAAPQKQLGHRYATASCGTWPGPPPRTHGASRRHGSAPSTTSTRASASCTTTAAPSSEAPTKPPVRELRRSPQHRSHFCPAPSALHSGALLRRGAQGLGKPGVAVGIEFRVRQLRPHRRSRRRGGGPCGGRCCRCCHGRTYQCRQQRTRQRSALLHLLWLPSAPRRPTAGGKEGEQGAAAMERWRRRPALGPRTASSSSVVRVSAARSWCAAAPVEAPAPR